MCDAHNINVYCSIFWYFRIQWYYVIIMENNLTVWGQAYQSLELSILPDLCPGIILGERLHQASQIPL